MRSICEKFTDILIENKQCDPNDKELVIFGLASAIEIIGNIISTLIIGFCLKVTLESIIFLFSFSFIRTYTGGYHAEKASTCYAMSSSIIIVVLITCKIIPDIYFISTSIILLVIAIPTILCLAPVAAKHKPLDYEEVAYFRKKSLIALFIELLLILLFMIIGFKVGSLLVSLSLFLVSILMVMEELRKETYSWKVY